MSSATVAEQHLRPQQAAAARELENGLLRRATRAQQPQLLGPECLEEVERQGRDLQARLRLARAAATASPNYQLPFGGEGVSAASVPEAATEGLARQLSFGSFSSAEEYGTPIANTPSSQQEFPTVFSSSRPTAGIDASDEDSDSMPSSLTVFKGEKEDFLEWAVHLKRQVRKELSKGGEAFCHCWHAGPLRPRGDRQHYLGDAHLAQPLPELQRG